jgi:Domain of unknown function (DUF4160)
MYFDDHSPPHFHAEHAGQNATFDFSGRLLAGSLRSATARKLIRQWARAHEDELRANWARAKKLQALSQIAPLE